MPTTISSRILFLLLSLLTPPLILSLMMNKTFILEWFISPLLSSHFSLSIIFDPTGMLFSSTVIFISANVLMFSSTYMKKEKHLTRFTYLILLFVLSMNMLVYFPNLIILLLGWDGLGLVSFILVIYYQNPTSLAAGMFTAITNRLGDVLLLISIGWSMNQGHWYINNMFSSTSSTIMTLMIMTAAMTKSAQMPFSSWLPAAMAAPTPVSALVHSSTLVTAGVFLLIRFFPFLSISPMFMPSMIMIASLTMLMAGMSAMTECDLKKIIALSTLSQLGVMMGSLGLGLPSLTLFHTLTHALFKALLFLTAGSLIHFYAHSQDLRSMGNTNQQMPITMSCLLIANLALCGTPFLAGFYSKDLILEMTLYNSSNLMIISMFFFATGLTSAYSIRMMLAGLWNPMNMSTTCHNLNNEDKMMTIPMLNLTTGAIMGGAIFNWTMFQPLNHPNITNMMKSMPMIITLTGILFSLSMFKITTNHSTMMKLPYLHHMFTSMWFLSPTSTQPMLLIPFSMGDKILKSTDQGWMEFTGPSGIHNLMKNISSPLKQIQNNNINLQMFMFSIPLLILLMP